MSAASRRMAGPNRVRRRPGMRVPSPSFVMSWVVSIESSSGMSSRKTGLTMWTSWPTSASAHAQRSKISDRPRPTPRIRSGLSKTAGSDMRAGKHIVHGPGHPVDAVIAELRIDRKRQARRRELVGDRKPATLHAVRGAGHPRLAVHRDRVVDAGRDPALAQLRGEPVAVGVEQHVEVPGVLGPRLDPLEANLRRRQPLLVAPAEALPLG